MQINTSSNLRSAFVPDPGKVLVVADLSQIEPRLTAHYSAKVVGHTSTPLLESFCKGLDLYSVIANKLLKLGVPESHLTKQEFKKMYPKERDFGKTIQLATTYGLGPKNLAHKLTKESGVKHSYGNAKKYIDLFWEEFWDIKALRQFIIDELNQNGYIDTLFGRKVYLSKADARHKGTNYKIQSSASDYGLFTQLWVKRECIRHNIPAKLLLLVHDEVIYQIDPIYADNFVCLLKTIMSHGWKVYAPELQLLVPTDLDVGVGDNWGIKD